MLVFLYLLAAMGVGYWARLDGRKAWIWFVLGVLLTPVGASIALMVRQKIETRLRG